MVNRKVCVVGCCNELFHAKGYCKRHYHQIRSHGKVVKEVLQPYPKCKVGWCDRPGDAGNGHCSQHHCQLKRFGEVRHSGHNPNDIVENKDGSVGIVLKNKDGDVTGISIIDLDDLQLIKKHKWFLDDYGYAQTHRKGRPLTRLHKILNPDYETTDHIDKNKLNNRRANLRECTHQQNCFNYGVRSTNTTGVTGVCWDGKYKKWFSQITINYKNNHLGRYDSKDDAIKARLNAEKRYFGDFAPQRHLYEQYGI